MRHGLTQQPSQHRPAVQAGQAALPMHSVLGEAAHRAAAAVALDQALLGVDV